MDIYTYGSALEKLAAIPDIKSQCEAFEKSAGFSIDELVDTMPANTCHDVKAKVIGFYIMKNAHQFNAEFQPYFQEYMRGFNMVKNAQQTREAMEAQMNGTHPIRPQPQSQQPSYAEYATAPGIKTIGERINSGLGGGVGGTVGELGAYAIPGVGTAIGLGDAGINIANAFGSGQTGWQRAGHLGSAAMNIGMAGASLIPFGGFAAKLLGKGITKGIGMLGKGAVGNAASKAVGATSKVLTPAVDTLNKGVNSVAGSGVVKNNPLVNFSAGRTGWQKNLKNWGSNSTWGKELPKPFAIPKSPIAGAQPKLPFNSVQFTGKEFMQNAPGWENAAKRGLSNTAGIGGRIAGSGLTSTVGGFVAADQVGSVGAETQGFKNYNEMMPGGNMQVVR